MEKARLVVRDGTTDDFTSEIRCIVTASKEHGGLNQGCKHRPLSDVQGMMEQLHKT